VGQEEEQLLEKGERLCLGTFSGAGENSSRMNWNTNWHNSRFNFHHWNKKWSNSTIGAGAGFVGGLPSLRSSSSLVTNKEITSCSTTICSTLTTTALELGATGTLGGTGGETGTCRRRGGQLDGLQEQGGHLEHKGLPG